MQDFQCVFDEADVIIGPTEPVTAPPIAAAQVSVGGGQESALTATWRLTYPYNLTGLPAITVPCGFDHDGLPIGLQIAARPFAESTILRAAAAHEAAHEWKVRRPCDG